MRTDEPTSEGAEEAGRLHALRHWFRARLRTYFLAGVLVTAPIAITIWLAWEVIEFFDRQIQGLIPAPYNPEQYLPFSIPGLGLVVFVIALTLIGALTAGFIGRQIVELGEGVLARMPVIRSIHGAVKQIFQTVLAQKSDAFRQVVLVEFPRRDAWSLGFVSGITQGEIREVTAGEMLNVFVPTTPNPTSGYLIFVPRQDVIPLAMTVDEGIKLVVSGGIVMPPNRRPKAVVEEVPEIPPVRGGSAGVR